MTIIEKKLSLFESWAKTLKNIVNRYSNKKLKIKNLISYLTIQKFIFQHTLKSLKSNSESINKNKHYL